MAEIKIEKKKPIWPWILVILIVLAIIAYLVYENQDRDDFNDDFDDDYTNEQVMDSTDIELNNGDTYNAANTDTYDSYTAYEGSISDSTRIAVDSSYTKKAYFNLTKAVVKKADEHSLEDSQALSDLRNFSMLYTRVSSSSSGSEEDKNFKTASDKVTKVLEAIQTKSYPELQSEVADLRQVTDKVDGSIRMNMQQSHIYAFLEKSRDVLRSMNQ